MIKIILISVAWFAFMGASAWASNGMVEPLASIGGAVGPVQLRGDLAYVGEGSGLTILDASDPDHPRALSRLFLGGIVHDLDISSQTAFVLCDIPDLTNGGYFQSMAMVDITDSQAPRLLGKFDCDGVSETYTISAISGRRVVAAGGKLDILDFTAPAQPKVIYSLPGKFYNVKVQGARLYAMDDLDEKLKIFDLSDTASPVLKGSYPGGNIIGEMAASGNLVYFTTYQSMNVLDSTNPSSLRR